MEEKKKERRFYSVPAKAGVFLAWILCVAIFCGSFAFGMVVLSVNQSFSDLFQGNGEFEETSLCASNMTQYMDKMGAYLKIKNIFEEKGEINPDKLLDISNLQAQVKQEDPVDTVYKVSSIQKMEEKNLYDTVYSLLSHSYELSDGADEEMMETAEQENIGNYSKEFQYLYLNGKKIESILPESGVTLADYAKNNPDTVSLMELYENLLAALEKYDTYLSDQHLDEQASNIWYFVEDQNTGNVFTNLPVKTYEEAEEYVKKNSKLNFGYKRQNGYIDAALSGEIDRNAKSMVDLQKYYSENPLISWKESVILAVNRTFSVDDTIRATYLSYERVRPFTEIILLLLCFSFFSGVILFVMMTIQAGRRQTDREAHLYALDRIPTEIELGGICFIVFFAFIAIYRLLYWLTQDVFQNYAVGSFEMVSGSAIAVAGITTVIGITGLIYLSLVRRIKAKNLWKNSLLQMIYTSCRNVYAARKTSGKMIMVFSSVVFLNFFLIAVFWGFGFLLALISDFIILLLLIREGTGKQMLRDGLARLASGDLEYQIDISNLRGENLEMAQAINHVGEGLQKAVQESMKSERLKADLITNVSHDIKTPLTSIINYVDLLKREEIDNQRARGYIDVLDSKSQRLKQLTEDLVEASKVSSGNITLEYIILNLNELIQQTNGEFSERFLTKNLELVCTLAKEPLLIRADGRRIWRIIENLYVNAAKYAMPGTRVYVDACKQDDRVVFVIKNISEHQLNIQADELTERFIRGDVSRSTEGSGLGLSIAKNLTILQRGTFDIYLDGDLFKVTVTFPVAEKEEVYEEQEPQKQEDETEKETPIDASYREL